MSRACGTSSAATWSARRAARRRPQPPAAATTFLRTKRMPGDAQFPQVSLTPQDPRGVNRHNSPQFAASGPFRQDLRK